MSRARRLGALILLGLFLHAAGAVAETLPWVRLGSSAYRYQTLVGSCIVGNGPGSTTTSAAAVYFSGELNEGKLTRAYLNQYPDWQPSAGTFLELDPSGIELYKDDAGHYWLSRLALDGRGTIWLFDKLFPVVGCFGMQIAAATVEPSPLLLDFDSDLIKEGVNVSYSQKRSFQGIESSGRAYEALLQLKQTRW